MHLKRKFVSRAGWELVPIPLSEFTQIGYQKSFSILRAFFGACLIALIVFILAMLARHWNDLSANTTVPVGALALAAAYGTKWVLGARQHRFVFTRSDGSKLTWRSRPGDDQIMQGSVDRLIEFARSRGLMHR
jgi:hypothetical protein